MTEPEGNPLDRLRCPGIDQDLHPSLVVREAGAVLGARADADRRVADGRPSGPPERD